MESYFLKPAWLCIHYLQDILKENANWRSASFIFNLFRLQGELSQIQKVYDSKQLILEKCYCELEKRIHEHDRAVDSGFDKPEITLGVS